MLEKFSFEIFEENIKLIKIELKYRIIDSDFNIHTTSKQNICSKEGKILSACFISS